MATDPNDPTTTEAENQPVLDRVQQESKYPDGTVAQMDGYELIEEEEVEAEEAAPQVSGAALGAEEPQVTPKRRSRKADVETTAER